MKVLFNEKRALFVFRTLAALWQTQKGIYRKEILPEQLYGLPGDPVQQANFLMYGAIPMRGAVNSDDPFQLVMHMYNRWPGMFDPYEVSRHWNEEKIARSFRQATAELKARGSLVGSERDTPQIGAASLSYNFGNHVRSWYHNSHTLARDWDGNLLNIYDGVTDFEQAFRRIDYRRAQSAARRGWIPGLARVKGGGFIGMRRKIFALLTIWLQEEDLIPHFPTPVPVDFHHLNLLWGTGVISFDGLKPFEPKTEKQASYGIEGRTAIYVGEQIVDQITKWSQRFLHRHGISAVALASASWVHSRQLCASHPQRRMPRPSKPRDEQAEGVVEPQFAPEGPLMKLLSGESVTEVPTIQLVTEASQEVVRVSLGRTKAEKAEGRFVDPEALEDVGAWPRNYRNECGSCPLRMVCTAVMPAGFYYRTGILVRLRRADYPQGHVLGDLGEVPLWGRKKTPKEREEREQKGGDRLGRSKRLPRNAGGVRPEGLPVGAE